MDRQPAGLGDSSSPVATLHAFAPRHRPVLPTAFTRAELSLMLSVYSRRVSDGAWRDYAIDHRDDFAIFSIFRHAFESPVFTIVKHATQAASAVEFSLFAGLERLECGDSLPDLLTILESRPRLVQG